MTTHRMRIPIPKFQPLMALMALMAGWQHRMPKAESAEYQQWRRRFINDRLRLTLWVILFGFASQAGIVLHLLFFNSSQFNADVLTIYGDAAVGTLMRQTTLISMGVFAALLLGFFWAQRTQWARRHPEAMFLALSLSLTLPDQIVGTWLRFPDPPGWTLEFLGQAVLIPVCWRLHLLSQLLPTAYYAIVYPLLGITQIGERSIYDSYTIGVVTTLFLVCLICDIGVYLYERLQQSEFESRQQLRVFLHSVSHDLKTPVMGTSIVLETLLSNPEAELTIQRSVLERLLQGSDRQLTLINSLLDAHNTEIQGIQLHCEALSLRAIVDAVVADLTPILLQNQIVLENHISPDLPLAWADANQLWRVYCNLITNAIKHNPHQITIRLTASLTQSTVTQPLWLRWRLVKPLPVSHPQMLRCTVTDDGVGIAPQQCQRLFDLYSRGTRARYMPGLGLGLYVCKQAIAAHGGNIGVDSTLGGGSMFWFTLPVASSG